MGIIELFDVGVFTALFYWANPFLTIIEYLCILVGMLIQWFLYKKYNHSKTRWALMIVGVIGIIICECVWHLITGWERLALDVVYGGIICIMIGAGILAFIYKLKGESNHV